MPQIATIVQKSLGTAGTDGQPGVARGGKYKELMTVPIGGAIGLSAVCEEGSYFKAINPTPGTGIAQTVQTTFSATNGVLSLRNAHASKVVIPDFIRLICTVVGASTTRSEGLIATDTVTRYSSGGSAITPVSGNSAGPVATSAVIHFGALTLAAEGAGIRRQSRFQLRAAIMVAFEEWFIKFGGADSEGAGTLGGTTALRATTFVPPLVIEPSHCMVFHLWNTANAATPPSWEFEIGYIER